MRYTIRHHTEYRFTQPVFFEPHLLRFQPRNDAAHQLLRFDLAIEPTPAGTTRALDPEGNVVTVAWFDGLHDRMKLRAASEVETLRSNPFDYLVTPRNRHLPIDYQPWETAQLASACRRAAVPDQSDPVRKLAQQFRDAASDDLVTFLTQLCSGIHEQMEVIGREDGPAWPAVTTLDKRQGSCRDLAVLFIDACRAVGLAARFVSGYQAGDDPNDLDLHGWAEVYLPGAGWRGYDPTHGLAVADRHIAIAASDDPLHAAPVTATYRGDNVEAELHTEVAIKEDSSTPATC